MGRKKVSDWPKNSEWLQAKIAEINAVRREDFTEERDWTSQGSLLMDRKNLLRLIELAEMAVKSGMEVGHFVYDPLSVVVTERGEVTLVDDLPGMPRPKAKGLVQRIIDEKIPIHRLRVCPICDDIYWMQTTRGITCGKGKCPNNAYEKTRPPRGKRRKDNGNL